jgi:hypothetical protein
MSNLDCSAPTMFCTPDEQCASCLQNSDCARTPATPLCSQDQTRCVQCLSKNDCAAGQQCKGGACQ